MQPDDLKRFERSPDTSFIVSRLRGRDMGATCSYQELSQIVGHQVDGSTGALQSARRILCKEDGAIWDCVPGEGVYRLNDNEIAATRREGLRKRIHNTSSKTLKELTTLNLDAVDDKPRALAAMSFAGLMKQASTTKAITTIENSVAQTDEMQPLPYQAVLSALKDK